MCYSGQIYAVPKYIKMKLKSKYTISSGTDEYFFIQLLHVWLHLTNNNFPVPCLQNKFLTNSYFQTNTPEQTLVLMSLITSISVASQLGIFRTNLPLLGTFVDFYNHILSSLRHFSRNQVFLLSTIKDTQTFYGLNSLMFGNTYLELKILENSF